MILELEEKLRRLEEFNKAPELTGLIAALREAVKALEDGISCSCTFGRVRRGPTFKKTCNRCAALSTIETLLKK